MLSRNEEEKKLAVIGPCDLHVHLHVGIQNYQDHQPICCVFKCMVFVVYTIKLTRKGKTSRPGQPGRTEEESGK